MLQPRFFVLVGIILVAALTRLLPHPQNVAPIAAIALFGGASFSTWGRALFIPLAAMVVSDLLLGFHELMPVVYLCFVAAVAIGRLVRRQKSVVSVTAAALASSLLFFLVTNFSVWVLSGMYPATSAGLVACYAAALPFFQHTLLGDLFFTAVLFGGFALAEKRLPALRWQA